MADQPKRAWRTRGLVAMVCASALMLFLALVIVRISRPYDHVRHPGTGFRFPAHSDIETITAAILNNGVFDKPDVETFTVPEDEWDILLGDLVPSERDWIPMKWEILGSLEIRKTNGQHVNLDLFWLPTEPVGAFLAGADSRSRKYYRGGNSAMLLMSLVRAYSKSKNQDTAQP